MSKVCEQRAAGYMHNHNVDKLDHCAAILFCFAGDEKRCVRKKGWRPWRDSGASLISVQGQRTIAREIKKRDRILHFLRAPCAWALFFPTPHSRLCCFMRLRYDSQHWWLWYFSVFWLRHSCGVAFRSVQLCWPLGWWFSLATLATFRSLLSLAGRWQFIWCKGKFRLIIWTHWKKETSWTTAFLPKAQSWKQHHRNCLLASNLGNLWTNACFGKSFSLFH